ncbi:MAG TPA: hypothetical protein VFR29_10455 [Steroidobacteraceae bacterium]|nr:hypothetical protein [Steroidobacteraceae bacterium]
MDTTRSDGTPEPPALGYRTRQPSRRIALTVAFLLIAPFTTPASAQETGAVCLVKTDSTGGKLGFAVRREDAARLTAAGFWVVACPASLDRAAAGIGRRCARLRGLGERSHAVINELYGLSVQTMCDAHDAWVRTRPGP